MEALSEKFLDQIAKAKNVTRARASQMMDMCINLVSAQLGIPFSDVYNAIYDVDYLKTCLRGKCSDLDLDECAKSCHCVVYEGVCSPRYFADAEKMNEDPDKYVDKMPTEVLGKIVKLSAYLYYNYDGGGLTDNTYDALEYHLNKRLKMRGRRYEKIGAPPVDKIRAKLPIPMASLDKVKPGSRELLEFLLRGSSTGISWSLKLDGVSGLLVYSGGTVNKVYTRGDGTIGGDVTYLTDHINFPVIKSKDYLDIVVRGEFILKRRIWQEKYTGSYSNARSFVSGKINSGHISQGLSDIGFVAYEIVSSTGLLEGKSGIVPSPTTTFNILHGLGFEVVQHGSLKTPTVFDLMTLYKSQRNDSSEYFIDGLVISIDSERPVVSAPGNPKHSMAFKMRLEEQIRQTKVLGIEWRLSRYGRYVPVAQYESVYIDGARLHRASAFNAAHVRDWHLGKGSIIKIARSGDVIPTIIDVQINDNITPVYPPESPSWHWKGQDIVLDDPDSNKTVQIKRIEHFFATIGVPRLREKTIEKLWDSGFKTIKSITNAKPADFIKIKGIGKKTSESHFKNIHEVMRRTRLDRYIPASTVLNLGIGRKLVKQLMRYHPSILEDEPDVIRRILKKKEIPGFGPKRIENLAENVPKFREFLYDLNREDIEYAMKQDALRRENIKSGKINIKIRGKVFVTTGFYGHMDLDIGDYIYDNLGNFSDTVTSMTEAVIAANLLDVSKKMTEAQNLKVPVLSMEEFLKKYDINIKKGEDDEEGDDKDIRLDPENEEGE